jgi:transcriptional regulator with XRE-family HTH domain
MPKFRAMEDLRRLGARIRARRLHLGQTRETVAVGAGISIQQLAIYERGEGHAPVLTLNRIARTLETSTSALLGETMVDNAEQIDELLKIHTHPVVGSVIRSMRAMTREDRKSLQIVASAFAHRSKPAETEARRPA